MTRTLGDITGELKDRIIEPSKQEAERMLAEARVQSQDIISQARQQAEEILARARESAGQTRAQMESDLDTAARNFMLKVQESLEGVVIGPVLKEELRKAVDSPGFLPKMLEQILAAFGQEGGEQSRIELLLPEKQKKELEAWCLQKCNHKMLSHVDVRFTDQISFGFKLGVEGSGSHFNFSEGLVEAFSEFCSPRFRRHFYPQKEK